MAKQQPTLIQVSAERGIYVNLNNTLSYALDRNSVQQRLKKGADPKSVKDEDIEKFTADTISFYFIAGTGLSYRVGVEITQKDFDRMAYILEKALPYTMTPNE